MIRFRSLPVSSPKNPSAPPQLVKCLANAFGLNFGQFAVCPQVAAHLHDQAGVTLLCQLDFFRKIMLDMCPHKEEIGHQQDAFGTLGHTGVDALLDVWFMQFAEGNLEDFEAGHLLHHCCHLPGGVIGVGNTAAVGHHQNCSFHCSSLVSLKFVWIATTITSGVDFCATDSCHVAGQYVKGAVISHLRAAKTISGGSAVYPFPPHQGSLNVPSAPKAVLQSGLRPVSPEVALQSARKAAHPHPVCRDDAPGVDATPQ